MVNIWHRLYRVIFACLLIFMVGCSISSNSSQKTTEQQQKEQRQKEQEALMKRQVAAYQKSYVDIGDPHNLTISYQDTKALFEAYDMYKKTGNTIPKKDISAFVKAYKSKASGVLDDFSLLFYGDPMAIYTQVPPLLPFYNSYREDQLSTDLVDRAYIIKAYQKVKRLLPEAKLPNIYVFTGIAKAGGTITPKGLVISTELFKSSSKDYTLYPKPDKVKFLKMIEMKRSRANYLLTHELMHYMQLSQNIFPLQDIMSNDLFFVCMIEGGAEFLSSLVNGGNTILTKQLAYAKGREKELFEAFKADIAKKADRATMQKWVYNSFNKSLKTPPDMGYYIGYALTKAYYDQATDKQEAFRTILSLNNKQLGMFLTTYEKTLQ